MLRIELFPAHHGDCILVEYGDPDAPKRILIDGGTPSTFPTLRKRLKKLGAPVPLELFVVTHIDADHIGGALELLAREPSLIAPKDVWFNAYHHLFAPDELGARQAEALMTAIEASNLPWNERFEKGSVVVPDEGPLEPISLPEAELTLLSPTWKTLTGLRKKWKEEVEKAGLTAGAGAPLDDFLGKRPPPTKVDVPSLAAAKFSSDTSKANASSIAFIFEHDGKRVLFAADAYAQVLVSSLKRVNGDGPHHFDAVKLSHHGSRGNTSPALLRLLETKNWLISTDSSVFGHPDPECVGRLVARNDKATIHFNYKSDYNRIWDDPWLREEYGYRLRFPREGASLIVNL